MNECMTGMCVALLINAAGAREFEEVNGIVAMEAEHATSIGWKLIKDGVEDDGSGSVDFKITFHRTGKYYVWVRGAAGERGCSPSTAANDCFVKFDGANLSIKDYSGPDEAVGLRWPNSSCLVWQWQQGLKPGDNSRDWSTIRSRPVYANVTSAGQHTFSIRHRAAGVLIDRVVMQREDSSRPSGSGPAETVKGEGSTRTINLAPNGRSRTSPAPGVRLCRIDGTTIRTDRSKPMGIVVGTMNGYSRPRVHVGVR